MRDTNSRLGEQTLTIRQQAAKIRSLNVQVGKLQAKIERMEADSVQLHKLLDYKDEQLRLLLEQVLCAHPHCQDKRPQFCSVHEQALEKAWLRAKLDDGTTLPTEHE